MHFPEKGEKAQRCCWRSENLTQEACGGVGAGGVWRRVEVCGGVWGYVGVHGGVLSKWWHIALASDTPSTSMCEVENRTFDLESSNYPHSRPCSIWQCHDF